MAVTTKEQERKALEKIKAIVAELGENSYVGTALEGCLEDARDNIEYDAAFSMKNRYESANKALSEANSEIAEFNRKINQLEAQNETVTQNYTLLLEKSLNSADADSLIKLMSEKVAELTTEVNNAAARIVENADNPESAGFTNAVKDHRAAKTELERCNSILKKLDKVAR